VRISIPVLATIFGSAVCVIDQSIKWYSLNHLQKIGDAFDSGAFAFILHKNYGIAFDISLPLPITLAISALIILAIARFAILNRKNQPTRSAFAILVIAGALGNLLDRAVLGYVVDYALLFERSFVNLSDALIAFGIIGIAFSLSKKQNA